MCSPHSNLACRGKHLHGCSVLTDKCHINMSQITFTLSQKPMYSHCQRLWKSFSEVCQLYMLTGLHTYKNCVNMADNSIIQPVWGRVFRPLFPTSDKINCMVRNIASAQNIVCGLQKGGLGTEGERVVPLFFPTRRDNSSAQTTSYTESQITTVYIHLSSALRSLIVQPLGRARCRSHQALHILSSQEPRGNPMCELR